MKHGRWSVSSIKHLENDLSFLSSLDKKQPAISKCWPLKDMGVSVTAGWCEGRINSKLDPIVRPFWGSDLNSGTPRRIAPLRRYLKGPTGSMRAGVDLAAWTLCTQRQMGSYSERACNNALTSCTRRSTQSGTSNGRSDPNQGTGNAILIFFQSNSPTMNHEYNLKQVALVIISWSSSL